MKRTNLVLDGKLLEEALRLSGERTYSRAVERALTGSGLWEGNLSEMRRDWVVGERTPKKAKRGSR